MSEKCKHLHTTIFRSVHGDEEICDDCGSPLKRWNGIFDEVLKNNKPTQYNVGIDTFQRMRANASQEEALGFIRWNIDKYNTRKKGQDIEDYKKIKDYCDEAIWWLENKGQE